jgi:predicted helicase
MRKHLLSDFTQIWHLDLHGNVRKNPKLSGTTHNVFGIQIGVGITIAVKSSAHENRTIWYHRVPEDWRRTEKYNFLQKANDIKGVTWQELAPDEETNLWLTEGMRPEFESYLSLGTREAKIAKATSAVNVQTIFKNYSIGVQTGRDDWMYDFDYGNLTDKVSRTIEIYNAEVSRWQRAGSPKNIDDFVLSDDTKIKWTSRLKECLSRGIDAKFYPEHIRHALYRPFAHQFLYFDPIMTHRQGQFPYIFPNPGSEEINQLIWLKVGSEWPMFALATNIIPDMLPQGGSQCFPLYTYSEDGTNRQENITDWALAQFQEVYGAQATKQDIFHYVYAVLHHPAYRERYAENLKRELPRISLIKDPEAFKALVTAGARLADIHINYEQIQEYRLKSRVIKEPLSWYVEKMRLTQDKTAITYNESLLLEGIPPECFEYRLGNRSALEWVIDQYQVSHDKRSNITSDPNRNDEPQYIVHLLGKVITVSLETNKIVAGLPDLGLPTD